MAKTKGGKRGGKKVYRRKGKRAQRKYGSGDFARVQVMLSQDLAVVASSAGGPTGGSQVYFADNFSLTTSKRAQQIAQAFQEYRISKIEMFVKPVADTYISDNVAVGTGVGMPYFYYMIDKTAALMNSTTTTLTLRNAGAKPIRLDDKTIKVAWKPSVTIGSSDAGPGGPAPISELSALHRTSPWITTNANAAEPAAPWVPNSVDHYGIVFGAEQLRGPLPTAVANVQFRLTFEFRKPLWYVAEIPTSPPIHLNLDDLLNPPVQKATEAQLNALE